MKKKLVSLLLALAMLVSLPALVPAADAFDDVPANEWYAGAVEYCRAHGLMEGHVDGAFRPDLPATRAAAAVVLYRLAGEPEVHGASGFSDVQDGAWYAAAVTWAARTGLTGGYGDGRFGVGDPVTREQLVTFFWRYAGGREVAEGEAFADAAQISAYAVPAVRWARAEGVLRGLPGNLCDPTGTASRAQLADLLMKFVENVGAKPSVLSVMNVMCAPTGIALTKDGALLVTDTYDQVVWRVRDGQSAVYAGAKTAADAYGRPAGGYRDGAAAESLFREPWAIVPFLGGWAVSDAANGAVRLVREDVVQTVMHESGSRFTGLAADPAGNLYVAETIGGEIRRVTPEGSVTTVARGLAEPTGLCWKDDALYVAETGAHRIVRLVNGTLETVAGSGEDGFADGAADKAAFSSPQGVAVADDGTVYVADTVNGALRRVRGGTVDTLLVPADTAQGTYPVSPTGLLLWGSRLYVCDGFARKLFTVSLAA